MKKSLHLFLASLALAAVFGLAGCAFHPIGADRVSGRISYQQLDRSALNSGECSSATEVILHRYDLTKRFAQNPTETLRILHEKALIDDRRDLRFALAELNFLTAERIQRSVKPGVPRQAPDYFLSAAIYAYLFLLGEGREPAPDPFDRRFRLACDFYNRAVAQGFATVNPTNRAVVLQTGVRQLPVGPVEVKLNRAGFRWNLDDIAEFLPADEFSLRGLSVRDRQPGLGSPLIVVGKPVADMPFPPHYPATLFLQVPKGLKAWSDGHLALTLDLISTYDHRTVRVADRELPLEADTTAPMAYSLNNAAIWDLDLAGFLSSKEQIPSRVYSTQPYLPGRIPIVFVHGTASSPIWWAEMVNTLRTDPVLRDRYQFWYFTYNTGNSLSYSANRLREELARKVQQLDPEGKDPALHRMVVVGHSQGGLLTKLAVTDTGDKLWHVANTNDFATFKLSPEIRGLMQTNLFFTPLPFVERVIFISTPHRGSYLASDFVRRFVRKFMSFPQQFLITSANVLQLQEALHLPAQSPVKMPTSLDGMSPKNKYLLELADIPPAPGVKAHSIVAIKGGDKPPKGGDGVVKYTSAHVPYVESEFVVNSSHSCQDKPATIEEVRRILLLHLNETTPTKP